MQGVYIANREYYNENSKVIAQFLTDYLDSVNRVNTSADAPELIAKLGIVASADIAKVAIPRSNIVCITGEDMVNSASAVLNILFNANPASVGGALPGDDLFYAG